MQLYRNLYFILFLFLLVSCNDAKQTDPLESLNDELKGLVLGDSLYSDFMQEVRDNIASSSIIERELFGNVLVKSEDIENQDNRFVYGVSLLYL